MGWRSALFFDPVACISCSSLARSSSSPSVYRLAPASFRAIPLFFFARQFVILPVRLLLFVACLESVPGKLWDWIRLFTSGTSLRIPAELRKPNFCGWLFDQRKKATPQAIYWFHFAGLIKIYFFRAAKLSLIPNFFRYLGSYQGALEIYSCWTSLSRISLSPGGSILLDRFIYFPDGLHQSLRFIKSAPPADLDFGTPDFFSLPWYHLLLPWRWSRWGGLVAWYYCTWPWFSRLPNFCFRSGYFIQLFLGFFVFVRFSALEWCPQWQFLADAKVQLKERTNTKGIVSYSKFEFQSYHFTCYI